MRKHCDDHSPQVRAWSRTLEDEFRETVHAGRAVLGLADVVGWRAGGRSSYQVRLFTRGRWVVDQASSTPNVLDALDAAWWRGQAYLARRSARHRAQPPIPPRPRL